MTRQQEVQDIHKVKRRETIYSICREYGITEEELIAANPELRSASLKKGTYLRIPYHKESPVTPTVPTTIPTDNELFANGTGWQLLGENLPHVSCRGLEINYKANRLRAGTEGRGVWEHDLWCPSETDLLESGTYNADAFKEANNDISSTAMVPSGKDVSYRAGNEVHLLPGFHASSGSHFHAFIHPCDRAGNSFKSLPISGEQPSGSGNSTRSSTGTEMAVTPNPNQGRFTLHLPEGAAAVESMTLWNAQGRQFPVDPRGSGPTISVSLDVGIPSGMYMLRLHLADGSILHTKIIIQP